ncbi:hypothetical protein [Roseomonas sp. HF4]|uniref:hypothetical protein n=1 Tax=Roseomonas sp. HF4 TaxID=2562313 RepID=UPI0010C0B5DE|nr:hypothetical protein [Roseomonas sp. HF4]
MADTSVTFTFKKLSAATVISRGRAGKGTPPTSRVVGKMEQGVLTLGGEQFAARTGPWGNGGIEAGLYAVKVKNLVNLPDNEGMRIPTGNTGKGQPKEMGFFIPLEPALVMKSVSKTVRLKGGGSFESIGIDFIERGGLGIHPDGNVLGTQGCIGILPEDAPRFYAAWNKLPITSRPTLLVVSGHPAASGEVGLDGNPSGNRE